MEWVLPKKNKIQIRPDRVSLGRLIWLTEKSQFSEPNDTLYDDSSIYCKILVISYFYFEMVMFHWEGMKMICT